MRRKTEKPSVSTPDSWEQMMRAVDDVAEMHRLSRVLDIPFSEVLEADFRAKRES